MPKLNNRLPKYRFHKASGQAVVTLDGQDHYLGVWDTESSQQAYRRKVSEWLAAGANTKGGLNLRSRVTIDEIFIQYWAFVLTYYVRDGVPTGEQECLRGSLKPLVNLYGATPAEEFGPLQLKAVREGMIGQKLSRRLINQRVNRIRRMFKWAVENELLSPVVLQGLQAVSPLKRGRCEAPDHDPIRALPEDVFDKTLPHLSPEAAAMAKLQWLTGMRPGEVVLMRTIDIDRSGQTWEYRPVVHKTQHHGHQRVIPLGPKAQEVLKPWLENGDEAYLFSPRRKMASWFAKRRQERKSPMTPSQAARSERAPKTKKQPGERYTTSSYGHAIQKACKAAGIPTWGPNRLRHSAATRLRKLYGLDAARVVLGHQSAEVTVVYAEADRQKAVQAMQEIG